MSGSQSSDSVLTPGCAMAKATDYSAGWLSNMEGHAKTMLLSKAALISSACLRVLSLSGSILSKIVISSKLLVGLGVK